MYNYIHVQCHAFVSDAKAKIYDAIVSILQCVTSGSMREVKSSDVHVDSHLTSSRSSTHHDNHMTSLNLYKSVTENKRLNYSITVLHD